MKNMMKNSEEKKNFVSKSQKKNSEVKEGEDHEKALMQTFIRLV